MRTSAASPQGSRLNSFNMQQPPLNSFNVAQASLNMAQARDVPASGQLLSAPPVVTIGQQQLLALGREEASMIDRIVLEVEHITATLDSAFLHSTDVPWLRKVKAIASEEMPRLRATRCTD